MKLKNAQLVELQPSSSISSSTSVGSNPVSSSASGGYEGQQKGLKRPREDDIESICERYGGRNITMNFHNVTAPISMFNQAYGHRSNGHVTVSSPFGILFFS
jgi:hypothetical protein